jgi:hypothetical protein
MTTIQHICVFCGSSLGADERFRQAAYILGKTLAQENIGLVYGGGSSGLMGVVANSALEHGGRVIGIIPRVLSRRETEHTGLTELIRVETMHERKAGMAERADAFVALPGGFGTFEELFEVITWAQLGIHAKPIAVVNIGGYFDPLLQMIQQGVQQGFIRAIDPGILQVMEDVSQVIPSLRARPIQEIRPKFMDLGQI